MNINTVVLTHDELIDRPIVSALRDEGFQNQMNTITFILIQNEHNFPLDVDEINDLRRNQPACGGKKNQIITPLPEITTQSQFEMFHATSPNAFFYLLGARLF